MKRVLLLLFICYLASCSSVSKLSNENAFKSNLINVLEKSKIQYEYFAQVIPADKLPKSYQNGRLIPCGTADWVSGFYPGTLLFLSDHFKDKGLYNLALPKLNLLEKEQFNKRTHDIGFMMYCSFGNAIKIESNQKYNEVLLNSAKSLASRYNPVVKSIRSWDSPPEDFLVIIDNLMNLELLFWATKFSGDSSFYNIAVEHANTTLKNHYRDNYSCYHVVNYDPKTGKVQWKKTHQGESDRSSWSRGQAWGLYGFTMLYRETQDQRYLEQANNIANYLMKEIKVLSDDYVPVWDFGADQRTQNYKDASAGAIIASALLELSDYNIKKRKEYINYSKNILSTLISDKYFANYKQNGGFLLKHSVGSLPHNSEVDVPLTYADYYFIEGILRYLDLNKK